MNVSFGIRQKPPLIATPRFGGTLPLPRVDCTATTIIPLCTSPTATPRLRPNGRREIELPKELSLRTGPIALGTKRL